MALLVHGKTVCHLCNAVIYSADDAVGFPPFITNPRDPLFVFNDRPFHRSCFEQHPLAPAAEERYRIWREATKGPDRRCAVCENTILDPRDYFVLDYFAKSRPAWNYAQFHASCLAAWPPLQQARDEMNRLVTEGLWDERTANLLLDPMNEALRRREGST